VLLSPAPERLPAFILAGGRSSRFGSDKARFIVDGEPLALRTARVLRACGLAPVLVLRAPLGLSPPGLLPELLEPDAPDRHPLYGVAAGLSQAAAAGFSSAVFCPCDLPDLAPDHVLPLLETTPSRASTQPLLCHLPVSEAARALAAAAAGWAVRRFMERVRAVEVGEIRNMNSMPPGVIDPRRC